MLMRFCMKSIYPHLPRLDGCVCHASFPAFMYTLIFQLLPQLAPLELKHAHATEASVPESFGSLAIARHTPCQKGLGAECQMNILTPLFEVIL